MVQPLTTTPAAMGLPWRDQSILIEVKRLPTCEICTPRIEPGALEFAGNCEWPQIVDPVGNFCATLPTMTVGFAMIIPSEAVQQEMRLCISRTFERHFDAVSWFRSAYIMRVGCPDHQPEQASLYLREQRIAQREQYSVTYCLCLKLESPCRTSTSPSQLWPSLASPIWLLPRQTSLLMPAQTRPPTSHATAMLPTNGVTV